MKVLYEAPKAILYLHEDENIIRIKWKSFCRDNDFREPLLKMLELADERGISKFIPDNVELGVTTEEDDKWFATEYLPKMVNSGIKKIAVVLPQSTIAQLSEQDRLDKVAELPLEITNVSSLEEAMEYLKD